MTITIITIIIKTNIYKRKKKKKEEKNYKHISEA